MKRLSILITIFFFGVISIADASYQQKIMIGSGLIYCCKHFTLITGDSKTMLGVNIDDKTFVATRRWFFDNIFDSLNVQQNGGKTIKSKYCLLLFSKVWPMESVGDAHDALLLSVPLTPEIFGPNYLDKVMELRKVMTEVQTESRK